MPGEQFSLNLIAECGLARPNGLRENRLRIAQLQAESQIGLGFIPDGGNDHGFSAALRQSPQRPVSVSLGPGDGLEQSGAQHVGL
jgi:hypothetical protein